MEFIKIHKSIFPLIKINISKSTGCLLGTGFLVGPKPYVVSAKHIFENNPLEDGEKYAIASKDNKITQIHRIEKIYGSEKYDIAYFEGEFLKNVKPLNLCPDFDSPNHNIVTPEYSESLFLPKEGGGLHIETITNVRKGNAVRFYTSKFPETYPVYCFDTLYAALQGASGAPVINEKDISVVGMLVANVGRHLLPAQVVKIQDGQEYIEERSYFLPLGRAIHSKVIIEVFHDNGHEVNFTNFYNEL